MKKRMTLLVVVLVLLLAAGCSSKKEDSGDEAGEVERKTYSAEDRREKTKKEDRDDSEKAVFSEDEEEDEEEKSEEDGKTKEEVKPAEEQTEEAEESAEAAAEEEASESTDPASESSDEKETSPEPAAASSAPAYSSSYITSAYASSELSEYGMTHTASRIIDGRLDQAWVEGASGQGIGETVTIAFDRACLVSGMNINAGYQISDDLFYKNSRPSNIRIAFSDGTSMVTQLSDSFSLQEVKFDTPKETSYVTIVIEGVYPGNKYEDTVISEVAFY